MPVGRASRNLLLSPVPTMDIPDIDIDTCLSYCRHIAEGITGILVIFFPYCFFAFTHSDVTIESVLSFALR